MHQFTATITFNIDGREHTKTVSFTAKGEEAKNKICEWANEIIAPLDRLEIDLAKRQSRKAYQQFIQHFFEAEANPPHQAQTAHTSREHNEPDIHLE